MLVVALIVLARAAWSAPVAPILARLEAHASALREGRGSLEAPIPDLDALWAEFPDSRQLNTLIGSAKLLARSGQPGVERNLAGLIDRIVAQSRGSPAAASRSGGTPVPSRVSDSGSRIADTLHDPFGKKPLEEAPTTPAREDGGWKAELARARAQVSAKDLAKAVDNLEEALEDGSGAVTSALYNIVDAGAREHVPLIARVAATKTARNGKAIRASARIKAVEALERLADGRGSAALIAVFDDPDPVPGKPKDADELRAAAIGALIRLGWADQAVMERALGRLSRNEPSEKLLRIAVLESLSGRPEQPRAIEAVLRGAAARSRSRSFNDWLLVESALTQAGEFKLARLVPLITSFLDTAAGPAALLAIGTPALEYLRPRLESVVARPGLVLELKPGEEILIGTTLRLIAASKDPAHAPLLKRLVEKAPPENFEYKIRQGESTAAFAARADASERRSYRNDQIRFLANSALEAIGAVAPIPGDERRGPAIERRDAIADATSALLTMQDRKNGSFPTGRESSSSPYGDEIRLTVAAIAGETLELVARRRPSGLGPETIKAVEAAAAKAREYTARHGRCTREAAWCGLRSFSIGYALPFLAGGEGAGKLELIESFMTQQQDDGGVGYGWAKPQSSTFGTAVLLRGLIDSRPDASVPGLLEAIDAAAAGLDRSRDVVTGLYPYKMPAPSEQGFRATAAPGDAGRSVVCESALRHYLLFKLSRLPDHGEERRNLKLALKASEQRLLTQIAAFRSTKGLLDTLDRSQQEMPHSVDHKLSNYYQLFQLRYLIDAANEMRHPEREAIIADVQQRLIARRKETGRPDPWSRDGFSGPAYGAAMTLRMLLSEPAPAR